MARHYVFSACSLGSSLLNAETRAKIERVKLRNLLGGCVWIVGVCIFAAAEAVAQQGAPTSNAVTNQPAAVPGELIVKLRSDFPACAHCLLAEGRGFAAATKRRILDQVRLKYRIHRMEPVFGGVHALDRRRETLRRHGHDREDRGSAAAEVLDNLSQIYLVRVEPGVDVEILAAQFGRDPIVEWVEPNFLYSADQSLVRTSLGNLALEAFEESMGPGATETGTAGSLPNDPFLHSSGSWGQDFPDLWGLFQIRAPEAWELSEGEGVIIAVVDSGLDIGHPDIAGNVWTNEGEIPGNGEDDDLNGFPDDTYGWDFTKCVRMDSRGGCPEPKSRGNDVRDPVGHGTHVAGIIAAVPNNGIGIAGVAPRARIMAVKALDSSGFGRNQDLADAVVYAAENGAHVINASWSGPPSQTIATAIEYATSMFDTVVIASVDNKGAPLERGVYPANLPEVIAVAATTETNEQAPFSNFGGPLDLSAPGGGGTEPVGVARPGDSILSLLAVDSAFGLLCTEPSESSEPVCETAPWVVESKYVRRSGTSMAAAYVSGVAGLIRSSHPEYTREQVRQVLVETASDLGSPGWDADFGYGFVQAAPAVQIDTVPVAHITTPENLAKVWERDFPFAVRGTAHGGTNILRSWELHLRELNSASAGTLVATGITPIVADTLTSLSIDGPPTLVPGRHYVLELTVEDDAGTRASDTKVFFVPNPQYAIVPIPDRFDEGGGNATLSAAGTRVAFVRVNRSDSNTTVWFYDSELRRLVPIAARSQATLDPSGSSVVFSEAVPSDLFGPRAILYDVATGLFRMFPRHVIPGPLSYGATRMAFASIADPLGTNPDESRELFLFDAPDGPLRQVTQIDLDRFEGVDRQRLTISADGRRVLFTARSAFDPEYDSGGLFLYDDETACTRLLTGRPGFPVAAIFPSMDAAGKKVAVQSDGLHIIDVDNDISEQVIDQSAAGFLTAAQISGDGSKLVFNGVASLDPTVGDEDLRGEVYVLDIASGSIVQATDRLPTLQGGAVAAVDATADTIVLESSGGTLNGLDLYPQLSRAVRRQRNENKTPMLSAPEVANIPEGERTILRLSAVDEDGDPLTFFAQRVPPFLIQDPSSRLRELALSELIDNGDGTAELAFSPRFFEAGSYPLRLAVFDHEGGVDTKDLTLVIDDTLKEGDADCDGAITAQDVDSLVHALFNEEQSECPTSDADADGFHRANDITTLLRLLS